MKLNLVRALVSSGLVLFPACGISAQEAPPAPPLPPDGAMLIAQGPGTAGELPPPRFREKLELLRIEGMHPGKVVTGAPFSAVAISEITQTLTDGNRITRTTQTRLYRDSQGRFRKEGAFTGFGPMAAGEPKSFVLIHDPVAGAAYVLSPETKTARQMPGMGKMRKFAESAGPGKPGRRMEGQDANTQVQDLGAQTIAGVAAQGKRVTHTIPAGQIGNEKPIVSTFETWYSPDLQMVVMSKRSDPRFGDTTYTVSNVQRSEPAASLFAVPSDYTMKQAEIGKHGRRFGGPGAPPPPGDGPPPPAPPAE